MLVLGRKEREHVLIGDAIKVTVVRARDGKVRLGIDAPPGLLVVRGELIGASDGEEKPAAGAGDSQMPL